MPVKTITWEDNRLTLIDQTRLPEELVYERPKTVEEVWDAIKTMRVRGAPAIGIAAAFGLYLGVRETLESDVDAFLTEVDRVARYLESARPTAVNLAWALKRIRMRLDKEKEAGRNVPKLIQAILDEACVLIEEDNAVCLAIGRHGLDLLHEGMGVLTHCNAGGLGTAQWGTALAPIYLAKEKGIQINVFADETRPVLQGARLTSWELKQAGIPVTLICDNMAAVVMARGWVQAAIVGTDRVAANGDFANKIGTYGVAVLAKAHGIPLYVAAPLSSIDMSIPNGAAIPIEERNPDEVTRGLGRQIAPEGVNVFNPAFDVTPAEYVTAFITEQGIIRPPFGEGLKALFA